MEIILAIAILIGAIGIRIYGPTFLTQRSLKKVIQIFTAEGATSSKTAKPLAQLNLIAKTGGIRYTRAGEYRQKALQALQETKLIQSTKDDNLYLNVDNLLASRLVERWPELAEGLNQIDKNDPVEDKNY